MVAQVDNKGKNEVEISSCRLGYLTSMLACYYYSVSVARKFLNAAFTIKSLDEWENVCTQLGVNCPLDVLNSKETINGLFMLMSESNIE